MKTTKKHSSMSPAYLFISAAIGGFVVSRLWRFLSRGDRWDRQFSGAYPRYSGAISAVTGGPPEDMNEMPSTATAEGPIYDGSQLARR